jgi:hypothetical protein
MKIRQFEYAVFSAGRMISGSFSVKPAISAERATQKAAWKAQELAHSNGWEFDLINFSVAIQTIS